MPRHARHVRKSLTRAQLIARNMRKRNEQRREAQALPSPDTPVRPTHTDRFAGYHVEQNGMWFTLYDPDGSKVGKAQRNEAAARALIPGAD